MPPWYAPTTFNAWCRRLLTPGTVLFVIVLGAIVATELLFDWAEKAVGAYLVTTNEFRPESGAIWEQGRQSDTARQTLAEYADRRRHSQRQVRQADTLGRLLDGVDAAQGAMVSADHFLELYLKLPPVLSHQIVSAHDLLALTASGRWARTFLEHQGRDMRIYLLDDRNQVVHRLNIDANLLVHVKRGEVAVGATLDRISDFAAHIYPAERFFRTLNTFDELARARIVADPEALLRLKGRIQRVGISEVTFGESVDLGFEVAAVEGPKVILMQGVAGDVRRLQRVLVSEEASQRTWSREVLP
ncbi:MAG: hypothetical protein HKP58_05420 [Desulfatitalea sp.]|nr:hypothetical protein [Desulfatitalea sp.]NNJ99833.1 hypothetical protein [Desulfatitalea sp.]